MCSGARHSIPEFFNSWRGLFPYSLIYLSLSPLLQYLNESQDTVSLCQYIFQNMDLKNQVLPFKNHKVNTINCAPKTSGMILQYNWTSDHGLYFPDCPINYFIVWLGIQAKSLQLQWIHVSRGSFESVSPSLHCSFSTFAGFLVVEFAWFLANFLQAGFCWLCLYGTAYW
jgi:hypothetical protein